MTLWRADNKGYCYAKDNAGVYESITPGYHESDRNMAIPIEEGDKLFEECMYLDKPHLMIPNNAKTWEKLGVRRLKGELVRLAYKQINS